MPSEYALAIDGAGYYPIPASWLDHPMAVDVGDGRPRLYAVSAAVHGRALEVRYAQPRTNNVAHWTTGAMDGPSGDGFVPASLRESGETWARSRVPGPCVEPRDVLRVPEIEHFRDLWAGRVDDVPSDEEVRRTIADGAGLTEVFQS